MRLNDLQKSMENRWKEKKFQTLSRQMILTLFLNLVYSLEGGFCFPNLQKVKSQVIVLPSYIVFYNYIGFTHIHYLI